ncbi:nucleotide-diphospho-sugar transferase [Plectosphaerella plurivora]|uniref:Nucleotide-diphospho-sugar transferase n=1 Tax=Plectosphaerella plurivora TaxID=936078 RepID=A0A9P8V7Q2_9PEZI|nr:nucleotide-diphospho-sugar transferase [Plectosphaerella plurivora]
MEHKSMRPVLASVFASRRVRLTVLPAFAFCLLIFGLYHGSEIRDFGTSLSPSPSAQTGSNPTPVADTPSAGPVDYSRFAYTQYVTNSAYLCNSVMAFAKLASLGSKADRLLMYPSSMLPDAQAGTSGSSAAVPDTDDARLIVKARDAYNVKLSPIEIEHRDGSDPTWAESFTKLLAFNQTQYDRVLSLDSDSLILQHMDELFLSPPAPAAMPRAYWLYPDNKILSSQLVLATPSTDEFARIRAKINDAGSQDYDMEILNDLYKDSALILPHRPYNLLTGEFRDQKSHAMYLGDPKEAWDPVAVYNEAKFLHFSDFPVPKPWVDSSESLQKDNAPLCDKLADGREDCAARDLWNSFYTDFREARKNVCGIPKRRQKSQT